MLYNKSLNVTINNRPLFCNVVFSFNAGCPESYWEPRAYDELEIISVVEQGTNTNLYEFMTDDEEEMLLTILWEMRVEG